MSGLWWIPLGLGAWLAAGLGVGLVIGPVLRRCSDACEAMDDTLDMDVHPCQESSCHC